MRGGLLVAAMVMLPGGCTGVEEMSPDQPCLDAAYSVAARTLDCTGDADLANARYEKFARDYRCVPVNVQTDPVSQYFHCSLAVGNLSCGDVAVFGDDLDLWFSVSNACPYIIEHADGTPLPQRETPDAGGGE